MLCWCLGLVAMYVRSCYKQEPDWARQRSKILIGSIVELVGQKQYHKKNMDLSRGGRNKTTAANKQKTMLTRTSKIHLEEKSKVIAMIQT